MTGGVLSLLTVPELVAQFRSDVIRAGSAWNLGKNPERFKRTPERAALVSQIRALAAELRSRAPVETLTSLIEDEDIDVRAWSCGHFRDVAPDLAEREPGRPQSESDGETGPRIYQTRSLRTA